MNKCVYSKNKKIYGKINETWYLITEIFCGWRYGEEPKNHIIETYDKQVTFTRLAKELDKIINKTIFKKRLYIFIDPLFSHLYDNDKTYEKTIIYEDSLEALRIEEIYKEINLDYVNENELRKKLNFREYISLLVDTGRESELQKEFNKEENKNEENTRI